MARIRTVKPEFFRHEKLQELGEVSMLVFSGLFCIADREGRFEWRPKLIKLDILPFLSFDMGCVLDGLAAAGFIIKYKTAQGEYGMVANWTRHQMPGRDEPPSEIPAPDGSMTVYDRPPNQTQRIKIYARDQYSCLYCGRDMKNESRAICLDHIIPYTQGGTNREKNLATACKKCNAAKGCRNPKEAGMKWPEGLGEQYPTGVIKPRKPKRPLVNPLVNPPVNPPVTPPVNESETDGQQPPVQEGEGEGEGKGNGVQEREEEKEGKGEGEIPRDLLFLNPDFSEAWDGWLQMRNSGKGPKLTNRAKALNFTELKTLSGGNPSLALRIVNQSIMRGWKGFFPLKDDHGKDAGTGQRGTFGAPAGAGGAAASRRAEKAAGEFAEDLRL